MQHSQASPNRCCQSISSGSQLSQTSERSQNSQRPSVASTLTGNDDRNPVVSTAVPSSTRSAMVNGHSAADFDDDNDNDDISDHNRDEKQSSTSSGNIPCNCKCDPKDFQNGLRSSQELRKETCKLVNSVNDLHISKKSPNSVRKTGSSHKNCKCSCDVKTENVMRPKTVLTNGDSSDIDDWSLMLIGLAQIHPTTSLVHMDPFDALPTISVVPPTPEGLFGKFSTPLLWDNSKLSLDDLKNSRTDQIAEQVNDFSPEDSPQDEDPPYKALNTSLKRSITKL